MVSLQLTDEQQAIVAHNEGPALVFAVAGAGKTTALVHRLERLVRERVFEPRKILATSFSRMAVDDLKRALSSWPHTQGVQVSTLHALGYRIVRKAASEGLLKLAEVKEEGAEQALLQRTLRRARELRVPWAQELENLEPEDFLSYLGACKGNLQYADLKGAALPPEALKVASQAEAPKALEWYLDLYRLFEQVRQAEGLLTFDDMLMQGWEVLVRYPEILQTVQKAFQAVLVDEFQDVNLAQSELLDLITAPHRNYMAVGDDDQTIYEWRGASPRFILEFAQRYQAKKYLIRDTFRCPAPQVALAGRVIAQNQQREPKRLSLTRGFVGRVHLRMEPHMPAQAQSLVSDIAGLLAEGRKPAEMVVLVRLYAQTPYLEQALIERQIPYRVVGSTPFYQRPEIQTLLAYLQLAESATVTQNPLEKGAKDAAVSPPVHEGGGGAHRGDLKRLWLQIYNTPKRYLTRALADAIWRRVEQGGSLLEVLRAEAAGAEERVARRLLELADLFEWLGGAVQRGSAHAVLEALEARLDYRRHLLRSSGFWEVGAGKAEGVRAFLEYARDKGSVGDLLRHIELLAQEHFGDDPIQNPRERVSLMTIFRAKGLEWPLVFIPDCNEGTLPYSGSENLEEERRLFYVALTRSSAHTYLYALSSLPLSPFLKEAEYLQVLGAVERVGEALALPPEELSTAQTLALAQGAHKLGLERYLYHWWNAAQAPAVAAKVLRLFSHAEQAGWLEALGLSLEARSLWEAFDVEPGQGPADEFADLERFLLKRPAPSSPPALKPGQKVRHIQFGTGLVVGLEDGVAMVAFGDGVRKLALRYARLEVVG
ncbi:ATP-dependent helicase [Meiothermus sp. CFH 77666]|uniref:ATP-dependent helicase n=1 Tax=Meiothermus sp. CFH 77666 TaxID=2817942 RepID=UPI001AA09321|nr:ATP-dependent helicase [Meiothermus sp. CFH 77666]MBO1436301.1 ATP-dependent helicase [Meiothermus sp. CFH 77666]